MYLYNPNVNLTFHSGKGNLNNSLNMQHILNAISNFNITITAIKRIQQENNVDIFSLLGMRNLSGFIGEIFVSNLAKEVDFLIKNPHQDGYPDLLLMDNIGVQLYANIIKIYSVQDKAPFSPFANGGIEIKATCGSVPSPKECQKKGMKKPDIGEQRINLLNKYDWKAHHRGTNNLLGLLWDFIDGLPVIVAVFFGNDLTLSDWGNIVQPTENGGRTTSVSIMSRSGVSKMYNNWVVVINDAQYINFLNKYNRNNLVPTSL